MNSELESKNPEPFRDLMGEWKVDSPLPPRFQDGVWRRIVHTEATGPVRSTTTLWSMFKSAVAAALPRPAFAAAYVVLLLFIGAGTGAWHARSQTARLDSELGGRYVRSVDPYQKPPHL